MSKYTGVIVDVDGTLVDVMSVRHHVLNRPKDFHAFHHGARACPPHQRALDYSKQAHDAGHLVIVVTARMEEWRETTTEWLEEHMPCPYEGPAMRPHRDFRPDYEVKRDIYNAIIAHDIEIVGAIDDNPKVVKLWESFGIETVVMPGWEHEKPA